MNKLVTLVLAVVMIVSLVIGGCAKPAPAPAPAPTPAPSPAPAPAPAPSPAPEEKWPDAISFAGGPSTSGAYARAAGLSVMIGKYLGVKCAPEAIGVPYAQLMAMRAGKAELAWPFARDARQAYLGEGDWAEEPLDIRSVIGAVKGSSFVAVTMADSGLVNFEDLLGKRVVCINPGGDWWAVAFEDLLEAYGMTMDDITPMQWTGHGEMIAAIDSGAADVGLGGISPINLSPAYLEQEQKRPLRVINIDQDKLEYVANKMGPEVTVQKYPSGLWKLQPEGYLTLVTYMDIVAPASLPESFIYSLFKMCFEEHHDEYLAIGRGIDVYDVESTIKLGEVVPLHAGVIKYLKEKGLWTDELEATQQKVLKEFGASAQK